MNLVEAPPPSKGRKFYLFYFFFLTPSLNRKHFVWENKVWFRPNLFLAGSWAQAQPLRSSLRILMINIPHSHQSYRELVRKFLRARELTQCLPRWFKNISPLHIITYLPNIKESMFWNISFFSILMFMEVLKIYLLADNCSHPLLIKNSKIHISLRGLKQF